jgi:hypothetical protein
MGELQLWVDQDYQNAHFITHYVAPGDGEFARFQPGEASRWDMTTSRSWRLIALCSRL